jgi:hypothetical protein
MRVNPNAYTAAHSPSNPKSDKTAPSRTPHINQAPSSPFDTSGPKPALTAKPQTSNKTDSPLKSIPRNPDLETVQQEEQQRIGSLLRPGSPQDYVNNKLRQAFDPGNRKHLDPEHTYLGYYHDGKLTIGGSMTDFAMSQGLEGAPDGVSDEQLQFFVPHRDVTPKFDESGKAELNAVDVEPTDIKPSSVRGFSWINDYHDNYVNALKAQYLTSMPDMQGNFKINFLRSGEQEQNLGLIKPEDQRIILRAMGYEGHERFSDLKPEDLNQKAPKSDIQISPLTINGHESIGTLVMTDEKTGRTVLYLAGNKGPFHGFASRDEMWNSLADKLKDPAAQRNLASYFSGTSAEMRDQLKEIGEKGAAATRDQLSFPSTRIPPGQDLSYYMVDKAWRGLEDMADQKLVTQGEVQRGEWADAWHKADKMLSVVFKVAEAIPGAKIGATTGDVISSLMGVGFAGYRGSVAVREQERDEAREEMFDAFKDLFTSFRPEVEMSKKPSL